MGAVHGRIGKTAMTFQAATTAAVTGAVVDFEVTGAEDINPWLEE